MRIAQIAPLTESVPPRLYGGTERVVSFLTDELVAMGHDVTLFASGDSVTQRNWSRCIRRRCASTAALRDAMAPHMLMLEQVAARADEFDVLHCHLDYWPFSLFSRQATPFLTTLHGRLDLPELRPIYGCFDDVPLVSISDAQRRPLPDAQFHRARCITDCRRTCCCRGRCGRATWRSSAGSARRSAPIAPSRSPARTGMQLKMAAKVDRADRRVP